MLNRKLGFLSLLLTSALFGSYGIFARLLSRELSSLQQLAYRYFLGFLAIAVILYLKKVKIDFTKVSKPHLILFAILTPFSFLFFILSLLNTKLSVGTAGFYSGVLLFTLVAGMIFFQEKMTKFKAVGLVFVTFGFLFLIFQHGFQALNVGFLFGVISGSAYGVTSYIKKKLRSVDRLVMLAIIALSTFVSLGAISLLIGEKPVLAMQPLTWFSLVAFGALALSAEYLTIIGFQNFDLYLGSIILALEIVFSAIFGFLFFGERLSFIEIVALGFVFVAVAISNYVPTKSSKRT